MQTESWKTMKIKNKPRQKHRIGTVSNNLHRVDSVLESVKILRHEIEVICPIFVCFFASFPVDVIASRGFEILRYTGLVIWTSRGYLFARQLAPLKTFASVTAIM